MVINMKKESKLAGLQKRKAISGYLFILPFIIGFLTFMVKPFFQSLYMSFCNIDVSAGGFKSNFNGIANYMRAFTVDTEFNRLLVEEISRMCINSVAIMVVITFVVPLMVLMLFKWLLKELFSLHIPIPDKQLMDLQTKVKGLMQKTDLISQKED